MSTKQRILRVPRQEAAEARRVVLCSVIVESRSAVPGPCGEAEGLGDVLGGGAVDAAEGVVVVTVLHSLTRVDELSDTSEGIGEVIVCASGGGHAQVLVQAGGDI